MSELLAYATLGFDHIVSLDAADHILFLLVLSAIYRPRDWRAALWVVSAFTVGHSLTLALSVTDRVLMPQALVEFLIPVTIAAAGVENLIWQRRTSAARAAGRTIRTRWRPMLAGVFGLVHGAGFAGYLKSLFVDDIAMPLLGFNIGIELGQLVVLGAAAACYLVLDQAIRAMQSRQRSRQQSRQARWEPFQLRLVAVSLITTAIATVWAVERFPA